MSHENNAAPTRRTFHRSAIRPAARAALTAALLAVAAAHAPFAHAQGCGKQSDFLARSDPLLAPVQPADCATLLQSPPAFTWPALEGSSGYTIVLTFPDGHSESRAAAQNWLAWDRQIPAGNYTWRVEAAGQRPQASAQRTFTVDDAAVPYVPPSGAGALEHAKNTARPRSWPAGAASPLEAARAERSAGFAELVARVDAAQAGKPVTAAPPGAGTAAAAEREGRAALDAAFAWAVTHEASYGAQAARRLAALARWSAQGPSGFARDPAANRSVAWTLALGYDWTCDFLDEAHKRTLRAAVKARTAPMYARYVASGRAGAHPYDAEAQRALATTAAIATLMAGDIPEADAWTRAAVPMALAWTNPWGGADGGRGNGTAAAVEDTDAQLLAWYVLDHAAGANLGAQDRVRDLPRYFAYFLPPGAPAGVFGDGAGRHDPAAWAKAAKGLASLAPTPLARWYAAQATGEDPSSLALLAAPRPAPAAAPLPPEARNSAYFPSIGWAAFHSRLDDPARASVYFRAGPAGSDRAAHADQDAFVIHDRGRVLAGNAAYPAEAKAREDAASRRTSAHNAITFDGGQGQGDASRAASAKLTRYEDGGAYAIVSGDATAAYGGALTTAQRTLVYLRESNTLVIRDHLASATPRTWEWNLHAPHAMTALTDTRVAVREGPAAMCVEMLASPGVAFSQVQSVPGPRAPASWHGRFATVGKSRDADFVTVLRIGRDCSAARDAPAPAAPAPLVGKVAGGKLKVVGGGDEKRSPEPAPSVPASATAIGGGWQVAVAGHTVNFTEDGASVR